MPLPTGLSAVLNSAHAGFSEQDAGFSTSPKKLTTFSINLHELAWSDNIRPFSYACTYHACYGGKPKSLPEGIPTKQGFKFKDLWRGYSRRLISTELCISRKLTLQSLLFIECKASQDRSCHRWEPETRKWLQLTPKPAKIKYSGLLKTAGSWLLEGYFLNTGATYKNCENALKEESDDFIGEWTALL